jgi:hypothetical protein
MSDVNIKEILKRLEQIEKHLNIKNTDRTSEKSKEKVEESSTKVAKSSTNASSDKNSPKVQKEKSTLNTKKESVSEEEEVTPDDSLVGIEGYFDGFKIHTVSGDTYDIPLNYAAKTKLVFGDKLVISEIVNGNLRFKLIDKVDRVKILGKIAKKESNWILITDKKAYELSPVIVEYNDLALGDDIFAFIPKDIEDCPFATFDIKADENAIKAHYLSISNKTASQKTVEDLPEFDDRQILDDDLL